MRVTIHGAGGGEVTGSAYLLQTRDANVLIDLGMFQGAQKVENYNNIPKQGAFNRLDAVVLTHAHLDHTGRLPLLTRAGYKGPIYATPATIDVADLILSDSAHLQQSDVERQNRRRARELGVTVPPKKRSARQQSALSKRTTLMMPRLCRSCLRRTPAWRMKAN